MEHRPLRHYQMVAEIVARQIDAAAGPAAEYLCRPSSLGVVAGAVVAIVVHALVVKQTVGSLAESAVGSGFPASRLFGQGYSFTYDDLIFHPGFIDFGANQVQQLPESEIYCGSNVELT